MTLELLNVSHAAQWLGPPAFRVFTRALVLWLLLSSFRYSPLQTTRGDDALEVAHHSEDGSAGKLKEALPTWVNPNEVDRPLSSSPGKGNPPIAGAATSSSDQEHDSGKKEGGWSKGATSAEQHAGQHADNENENAPEDWMSNILRTELAANSAASIKRP